MPPQAKNRSSRFQRVTGNAKKIGRGLYNNTRSRVNTVVRNRLPSKMADSEYRVQEAKRRKVEAKAARKVDSKTVEQIQITRNRVIEQRAASDWRLMNLLEKVKNGKANANEKRIYQEIVDRTTMEVMEKMGMPLE